jgi:hypothetical protein
MGSRKDSGILARLHGRGTGPRGESAAGGSRIGQVANHDLAGYHIAANAGVTSVEAHWLDEHDPYVNAMGSKGISEIGIVGTAAAVVNAVHHATGVRIRDLPVTLDEQARGAARSAPAQADGQRRRAARAHQAGQRGHADRLAEPGTPVQECKQPRPGHERVEGRSNQERDQEAFPDLLKIDPVVDDQRPRADRLGQVPDISARAHQAPVPEQSETH